MKERKAVYYIPYGKKICDEYYNGIETVSTFDVYGIFKESISLEDAKKNGLLYSGNFNNLSYSEKKKIAKNTIVA